MKNAIITGGAKGIGLGITKALSRDGFRVVVFGRQPYEAVSENLKELENCEYVQGDITSAGDRARLIAAAGTVDVLVNNAGVAPKVRADILELDEEGYDYVMNINLKSSFFMTQAASKNMVENKTEGIIVNVSSVSAYTSSVNRAQYCLSKAGISMSTLLYADRLAEYGIRVYEVRPGIIRTDMTSTVTEKYNKLIFEDGITPIRRWGEPEDVAKAVSVLAGKALPFSTGEVINVDGGFHIRRL